MASPVPDMASSSSALITDSGQGIGGGRGGQAGRGSQGGRGGQGGRENQNGGRDKKSVQKFYKTKVQRILSSNGRTCVRIT